MMIPKWLTSLFRKRKLDAEMDEEMRAHVEMRTQQHIAAGLPPDEARAAARRQFGWMESLQEKCRDQRGVSWLEHLARDTRYGARVLLQNPGLTITVAVTLGLGIGANTAVFSLINAVLLKSLPVREPERLALFSWAQGPHGWPMPVSGSWETDPVTKQTSCTSFSKTIFERFRDRNQVFSDVFAFAPLGEPNVKIDGAAEISSLGQLVSGGYFAGLGAPALLGRTIGAEDDLPGAAPVAVISHGFWQRRFGGDPAAVGKSISINNSPVTIIGVTAPNFLGALDVGDAPDFSVPLALGAQLGRRGPEGDPPWFWWLRVMGRLKPGINADQARASLEPVFQEASREAMAANVAQNPRMRPETDETPRLVIGPGGQGLTEARHTYRRELMIVAGLVGFVLLIACANVANLLLARGAARRREIAVRLAVGASRGRVVWQLLTESVLLAFLGAALGLLVAHWGKNLLLAMRPLEGHELALNLSLDRGVLAFTTVVAVITGITFGLAPALRATRVDLSAEFHGGPRNTLSGGRSKLSGALMVLQVALSLVLLTGAGLFLRTIQNLRGVELGFNRDHLLLFRLDAGPAGYEAARFAELHARIAAQIGSLPGVRSVMFSQIPLLSQVGRNERLEPVGAVPGAAKPAPVMVNSVSESFFSTLELPILLGRGFDAHDIALAPKVVVINQQLARQFFGDENPIGHRLVRSGPETNQEVEIVGVARDAKYNNVKRGTPATAYFPYLQDISGGVNYAVRTMGDPVLLTSAIRKAVAAVDANLPLADARTQAAQVERLFANERFFARISGFFGAAALALVSIGLYGLVSYTVACRTREIGIRMALGAQKRSVLALVIGRGMKLALIGAVAGVPSAIALTLVVRSFLFGVAPYDPITLISVSLILLAIAGLACWLPARRAAQVDPMVALRQD